MASISHFTTSKAKKYIGIAYPFALNGIKNLFVNIENWAQKQELLIIKFSSSKTY